MNKFLLFVARNPDRYIEIDDFVASYPTVEDAVLAFDKIEDFVENRDEAAIMEYDGVSFDIKLEWSCTFLPNPPSTHPSHRPVWHWIELYQ